MARLKRGSRTLEKATHRAVDLERVDPGLNFGCDVSLAAYRRGMARTQKLLKEYNFLLAQVDGALFDLVRSERQLADLSGRLLKGVAARYGSDSLEYQSAGGTRKSKIRRARRPQSVRGHHAKPGVPPPPAPPAKAEKQPGAAGMENPGRLRTDPEPSPEVARNPPRVKPGGLARARMAPPKACQRARRSAGVRCGRREPFGR